eukprot:CAMPEP_0169454442 /NCGR_PEP_ID=MMETSP1042-20121227/15280_1 /TAXON_ID=464988 /ORGANISM="Hemiselmis andersenii, Strain CCMP1180" /LENGTH=220 /DNA_ID=CAMNT_0009566515 /DNA_START=67 /DNA_END=725 /DNA_ORIENTATION=+
MSSNFTAPGIPDAGGASGSELCLRSWMEANDRMLARGLDKETAKELLNQEMDDAKAVMASKHVIAGQHFNFWKAKDNTIQPVDSAHITGFGEGLDGEVRVVEALEALCAEKRRNHDVSMPVCLRAYKDGISVIEQDVGGRVVEWQLRDAMKDFMRKAMEEAEGDVDFEFVATCPVPSTADSPRAPCVPAKRARPEYEFGLKRTDTGAAADGAQRPARKGR